MKAFTEGPESDIAELVIQFTRDNEAVASVDIRPLPGAKDDELERQSDYALIGFAYMANMLFNLGDDPAARDLLGKISERGEAIGEAPNYEGRFSSEPIEWPFEGASITSTWRAVLRRRADGLCVLDTFPDTAGDPKVLASISTLALFDYLHGATLPGMFLMFLVGLGAITNYYEKRSTSSEEGRFEGPQRALLAIEAFTQSQM